MMIEKKYQTTKSIGEFEAYLRYYFEKYPLHKEVFNDFYMNGQFVNVNCPAENKYYPELSYNADFRITNEGIVVLDMKSPLDVTLCFPLSSFKPDEDMNTQVERVIVGLSNEQVENSPHKYRKCRENGTVIDFGCSEGIFPGLYCNSTNKVIGIDTQEEYCQPFLTACRINGIEDCQFVHTFVDDEWEYPKEWEDENIVTIKMDIEGYELLALIKMKELIRKNHPQLQICSYHTPQQFREVLEYCINELDYTNFSFNKGHLLFEFDQEYPLTENFLRQTLIFAE